MKKRSIAEILAEGQAGQSLEIYGWARSVRNSKNNVFIALNDGSCLANLQLFIDKEAFANLPELQQAATGACIKAAGVLTESPGSGQRIELKTEKIEILGACPEDYPLQKKRHSVEFLREIAHLRGRTNLFGAVMRVRHAVSQAVHKYFNDNGYFYIHTPVITGSDAEGAGEMFQVTTLPLGKLNGEPDYSKDFFGKKTSLTVSGQLNGEAYAAALGKIYTFGPTFRAENSNTVRHLSEFWMIEPELSFCDLEELQAIGEEFLKYLINFLLAQCAEDMAFFNQFVKPDLIETLQKTAQADFKRLTYTQAIEMLQKAKADGKNFEYPCEWGDDMKSEHERYITEEILQGPAIITDYPKEIKSFYMKLNADGKTVRGMDVIVPGVGEIIGGSQREENYETLRQRMRESGMNMADYQWYLDLRKYGSAPHSGFGLGLERFLMWATGIPNMRDVVPFPRAPKLCDF